MSWTKRCVLAWSIAVLIIMATIGVMTAQEPYTPVQGIEMPTFEPLVVFDLYDPEPSEPVVEYDGFDVNTDYLAEMVACCAANDSVGGYAAEQSRNLKIDTIAPETTKVSYDELYLLAKVIYWEAGSTWLSEEWKMSVGEVLLNRVASPEFPDTLYDCVYQRGQYASVTGSKFQNTVPSQECAEIAARLLCGERILNEPTVVFQAGFKQGSGVCTTFYDSVFGTTYLCYSSHPEMYTNTK